MASGAMSWSIDRARPCPETSTVNNNNNIQYPRSIYFPAKKVARRLRITSSVCDAKASYGCPTPTTHIKRPTVACCILL
ncbi:hypothetical protein V8C43DRAFT_276764 [Trichoderma afarasin]